MTTPQERFLSACQAGSPKLTYVHTSAEQIELYLPGSYRMFALWRIDGAQAGAHLRFQSASAKSRMFRAPHNWGYLQEMNWDRLPEEIAESRRIAGLRGAGIAPVGGFPDVYKPLLKALKSMKNPPLQLHAGGPRAKVYSGEQTLAIALCELCKKRVANTLKESEVAKMQELEMLIEDTSIPYEILFPASNALPYSTGKKMREADEAESPAIQATRGVLGCRYGSQKCIPYVSKVLERSIRSIEGREGEEAAREFVLEIDELIMKCEFVAAYTVKIQEDPPKIERVLWRGADKKGFPVWWLVRINKNSFGLLGKLGRRWAWHPGDWESTLAVVPDEHFENAAYMAHARNEMS